jgi:hypothetical protein
MEVLSSTAAERDLIWRTELYRVDTVKMRSSGWALIQHVCGAYRKRNFNIDRHARRATCAPESREPLTAKDGQHPPGAQADKEGSSQDLQGNVA